MDNNNQTKRSKSIIFVKNLKPNTTENDLIEFFSKIGPIQRVCLVQSKKTEKSKLKGFVAFSIKEDAERAMIELNKKNLKGSFIELDYAIKKDCNDLNGNEDKREKILTEAQRTISFQISNLIKTEELEKLINDFKIKPLKIEYNNNINNLTCGTIVYSTIKEKLTACGYLQGKSLGEHKLNSTTESKVDMKSRNNRIKIFNVDYKETSMKTKINSLLSQIGFILEIKYIQYNKTRKSIKDHLFVKFRKDVDAKKAVESLNNVMVGNSKLAVKYANCDADNTDAITKEKNKETKNTKTTQKDTLQEATHKANGTNNGFVEKKGSTIFITNIPLNTEQEDLYKKFKAYGNIHHCRLVVNPITNTHKGTGFVCFYDPKSASKCVKDYELLMQSQDKATAPQYRKLALNDRILNIKFAVSKEELQAIENKTEQKDGRNIRLASEGAITEDVELQKKLTETEITKRKEAYIKKRETLNRVKILKVSDTRIVIHNLEKNIDEKILKETILKIIKTKKTNKIIRQVKIVRDEIKVDTLKLKAGKEKTIGKSKGYAFVEFFDHNDALFCLRFMNHNLIFNKQKRLLWVEFAIENPLIQQKRQFKLEKSIKLQNEQKAKKHKKN